MAVTNNANNKDLFLCMKEAVPAPVEGFRIRYIEAAKFLEMKDLACDFKVIKATHSLYQSMARTPFTIDDYLYAVKKAENLQAVEFLTNEKTVSFLKGNLENIRAIANDGRNIQDRDSAMLIGFLLGMVKETNETVKNNATGAAANKSIPDSNELADKLRVDELVTKLSVNVDAQTQGIPSPIVTKALMQIIRKVSGIAPTG